MMKISVVIPTYNRSELLSYTLQSIVNQTLAQSEFEVIVVDDGGTDNCRETCDAFAKKINIRYYWQPDNGFRAGKARNIGVTAAEGQYIVFIDSGVLLAAKTLENHLRQHELSPSPLVCIGYVYGFEIPNNQVDEMLAIISPETVDQSIAELSQRGLSDIRQKQYDEFGFNISSWPAPFDIFWTCHVSAEKEELMKVGLFDESFNTWGGEDVDLGVRLFMNNNRYIVDKSICSLHWPHKKYVEDHNKESETAAQKIHKKYNLWQTSFYGVDLNNEKYSLNKVINILSQSNQTQGLNANARI
ncbi:glycosyltransferase [Aliikangiella coralliicola]|uniref:Glycosyltransferase n=2 Tax=Aliikangiella coralliicola TaxID=2592383 RepID=A0A545UGT9_9GAMM|nr:glycosyltransferase [Aliikangiella coralliicola]